MLVLNKAAVPAGYCIGWASLPPMATHPISTTAETRATGSHHCSPRENWGRGGVQEEGACYSMPERIIHQLTMYVVGNAEARSTASGLPIGRHEWRAFKRPHFLEPYRGGPTLVAIYLCEKVLTSLVHHLVYTIPRSNCPLQKG